MSTKILLADDSVAIQNVVGIIFNSDEYSLTMVDNGKSALEKAIEILPDIMLIDTLMPKMSGYETCKAIRATPALASKPILLLTGSFEAFDEQAFKKCGANDSISKPFDSEQLINKVKDMLANARLQEATAEVISRPDNVWSTFTTTEWVVKASNQAVSLPASQNEEKPVALLSETAFPKDLMNEDKKAALPVFTEDQLKAAIAGTSKDIIEKIVREIVPDLAEKLIKEAIQKIKDGK